MGTPEFAVESLKALVEDGYNVVAVVTQPDKPVGRHGSVLQASQVKQYALAHNIPVLQPEKMKDEEFIEQLRSYQADLQVVVAFRMLPEVVWGMPRFGTFNVHASLLPQYRGAAPINWAVINGETETGVTTFFLDHEIDTGRIILQEKMPISLTDDVGTVYDKLMVKGAEICKQTINLVLEKGNDIPTKEQSETIVPLRPAPKIFKDTCRIDWSQKPKQIYDFIRGLSPYPGAWTMLTDSEGREQQLKVYKAELTDFDTDSDADSQSSKFKVQGQSQQSESTTKLNGIPQGLQLLEVQLAGKKRMPMSDFLNGLRGSLNLSV